MSESLFQNLTRIGIDEELAHQVSASLDPDYNASKKDVLVMQEAILQVQARTDERYYQMKADTDQRFYQLKTELKTELTKGLADVRTEVHSLHRQYIYTFGGLLVTIITVLGINLYFH